MTPKSLHRLLLGVALAGAAALPLTAGHAQAATHVCSFPNVSIPDNRPSPDCSTNPTVQVGDKILTVVNGPNAGSGIVDFEQTVLPPPGFIGDLFTVDIDYDPALTGAAGGTSSTFDYKLAIDQTMEPNLWFNTAALSYNVLSGSASVTKQVWNNDQFSTTGGGLLLAEIVGPGTASLSGQYKEIWVRDIITVSENAVIDNITNSFTQVPAPLPLLGAGTAFGFSRRLRRRCGKVRMSLG